jgi:glycosyltransferase involved in cell wall biosynthesis
MINFVTNLPPALRSGGFSAMNAAAFDVVSRYDNVNLVGPINPPLSLAAKVRSKAARLARLGGDFFAFSQPRLDAIARMVGEASLPEARLDFFHGFTPWVATSPQRPYMAWSDCTFRDYMDIYHRRADYDRRDLERIERAEAEWLGRARQVAFTSRWAAERATDAYGLDADRIAVVGIFGEVDPPTADAYQGLETFLFVSTNFEAKGGPVALQALRIVRERRTEAGLVVIGDCPPDVERTPGVTGVGYLSKEDPAEYARFRDLLSRARAVVHPTRSDIAPLLLVEAAYFGCPAISSRRFAIPELVQDGVSGVLLDDPGDPAAVASAMTRLLEDHEAYRAMRQAAWGTSRERHSKAAFEARLLDCLRKTEPS